MPVFRTVEDAQNGSIRLEAIHEPIYDSTTVSTAGITTLFTQGANNRSALYTNLTQAGSLTWPQRFSIRALRAVTSVGGTYFTDLRSFFANTYYNLVVGPKPYLTVPAFLLTPGVGLDAALLTGNAAPATPANGIVYGNHGWPEHRNIYSLLFPIFLPPVQSFKFEVNIASGASFSPGFTLWIFFEGEKLREIL